MIKIILILKSLRFYARNISQMKIFNLISEESICSSPRILSEFREEAYDRVAKVVGPKKEAERDEAERGHFGSTW